MTQGFVVQRQRHTQSGRDTVNVTVVPIVFVPGVMGSRLLIPGGRDWDPDSAGGMVSWAAASLDDKIRDLSVDRRARVDVSQIFGKGARSDILGNRDLQDIASALDQPPLNLYSVRGWAGISWNFYGVVLRLLESTFNSKTEPARNPVYAFGYDFRRSNFDSGDALLDFVAHVLGRHPGAQQTIIVTHSMGGLVARAALSRNPAVTQSIRGVVHGAQPANGAVVAYRRFFTGATRALDGGLSPTALVIRGILGTNPNEYASLQAGLPGPMQLLPNQIFHKFQAQTWLQTAPQVDLSEVFAVYGRASAPGLMQPTTGVPNFVQNSFTNSALQSRLDTAASFHEALASVGHPNTYILFSDGVATDARVNWTAKNPFASDVLQTPSGDGTVPADSARCPNIPEGRVRARERFEGIEHSAVYTDGGFNARVVNAIRVILSQQ